MGDRRCIERVVDNQGRRPEVVVSHTKPFVPMGCLPLPHARVQDNAAWQWLKPRNDDELRAGRFSIIKYQNLQAIIFYDALPATVPRESFDNSKEAL